MRKHNDINKHIDYGLHNYRASRHGECGIKISKKSNMNVIDEGEDSDVSDNSLDSCIETLEDKEKKKGVSKKDSLTVFSTKFFSYVQYNPVLFYFYKGNGLIIFIIQKRRLYKKSCTNCYILNVALADLCLTLICVIIILAESC